MANIIQPKFWRKLLTIAEIMHYDADSKCIWKQTNLPNIMHADGEEFILSIVFDTDSGISIPTNYYLGLDQRSTLTASDQMVNLVNEPSINGYARQAINSTTGFFIDNTGSNCSARSAVATFTAIGGQWGPVNNLFLTNKVDNTGFLIATAPLTSPRTVLLGETLSLRITLSLSSC